MHKRVNNLTLLLIDIHSLIFCFRFWDVVSMSEFKSVDIGHSITSMELSKDGTILVVTYGKVVSFWDTSR